MYVAPPVLREYRLRQHALDRAVLDVQLHRMRRLQRRQEQKESDQKSILAPEAWLLAQNILCRVPAARHRHSLESAV